MARIGLGNRPRRGGPAAAKLVESMPFPLAHPAAVLPLRRLCPRYLRFSALIIGSLSPDLGYFSGPMRLEYFSHRFFAGAFGFCVPVGLLVWLLFYFVRPHVVKILPARFRWLSRLAGQRPVTAAFSILLSLLLGAWTHLLLDSITHPDYWLLRHVPVLQQVALTVGEHRFRTCDLLYAGMTFFGLAWLAHAYLCWMQCAGGSARPVSRIMQWGGAFLPAVCLLAVAMSDRGGFSSLGMFRSGFITAAVLLMFFASSIRTAGR